MIDMVTLCKEEENQEHVLYLALEKKRHREERIKWGGVKVKIEWIDEFQYIDGTKISKKTRRTF